MNLELRDSVREDIIKNLFSGRFQPGEHLVERALAEELGVSRIPVREAITQLVSRGVLVRNAKSGRGGVQVPVYTSDFARELYELRAIIESGAARIAAQRATENDLIRLESICDEMQTIADEHHASTSMQWAQLENAFHKTIIGSSHNQKIIRNYDLLIQEAEYLFYFYFHRPAATRVSNQERPTHNADRIVQDHREIAAAIRNREAARACDLAREHIQRAANTLLRSFMKQEMGELQDVAEAASAPPRKATRKKPLRSP